MKHLHLGRTAERRATLPSFSGGVDYSQPPHLVSDDRLSDACNVWWNNGRLTTRPALRTVATDSGIASSTATAFPLTDNTVVRLTDGDRQRFLVIADDGTVRGTTVTESTLGNVLVVAAGQQTTAARPAGLAYCQDTGKAHTVRSVSAKGALSVLSPYVPQVLSAGRATTAKRRADSGAQIQPLNLLTPAYTCGFTTDGEGIYYWLPKGVNVRFDAPLTVTYTADGKTHQHTAPPAADIRTETDSSTDDLFLKYEPSRQCFYFIDKNKTPVALPIADAADNLILTSECVRSERFDRIYKMTFGIWYGEDSGARLFVSGHPNHPNRVHWSALNDPLYFPENNDAYVGDASSAVTAFGKQGDLLVIFKEHETYAAACGNTDTVTTEALLSGAVTDTQAMTVFPIRQIHSEIGCDCPATVRLCGERLVWMTRDGHVYALYTGGTYDARRIRPLSRAIEPKLWQHTAAERATALATRCGERYLLMVGNDVFVLDHSAAGFDTATQDRIPWFLWETDRGNTTRLAMTEQNGTTFVIGTTPTGGVYTAEFTDESDTDVIVSPARTQRIAGRIVTKQYTLGAAERYKHIGAVTVWIAGDGEVRISWQDGDTVTETARLFADTRAVPHRIALAVSRVRHIGLVLETTGRLALDGIQLTYRRMGEIRE